MKKAMMTLMTPILLTLGLDAAQDRKPVRFWDENGDGIHDFARDHDGDGLANCQDPDWKRPADGTGSKFRRGFANPGGQAGRRLAQNGSGHAGARAWNKAAFRQQGGRPGCVVPKGAGPGGGLVRRGRR